MKDFADTPVVNGKPAERGNFRIFVFDPPGYMAPAHPASTNGNTHHYSLAVPKTRSLRLFFDTQLGVKDASNATISAGVLATTVAVGTQPVNVQLAVQ